MAIAGIGDAVAHQDKPNLFAAQAAGALARLSAEESRREAARRKAQEKDEADTKKVIGDADIYSKNTTWHKMYAPAVQREMADFANDYINYKTQNPNAPGNGAYAVTKLQELQGRMNRLKQNNDAFKDFEKGVHEGKYYADPDLFKKIYETDFSKKLYRDDNGRVVSGDWGGLKTDERYGAMIDANGDFISNPVKKFDFQNRIGGFMNNSNVWTEKEFKTRSQKDVPGMFEDVSVKEVDPLQRESFVDEMVSNPDAVRAWQIENKDRLDDARKKDPSLNNERNYSRFVQKTMAEDVRLKTSGRKEDRVGRHIAPPKPPKAAKAKGPSLDASFDELKDTITETDTFSAPMGTQVAEKEGLEKLRQQVKKDEIDAKEYTLSETDKKAASDRKERLREQEAAYGKEGVTDVKYSYPTTLKTVNQPTVINIGPDVIDLKTNKAPNESNQLKFVPRKIGMLKVKGKWGAYVFGESYDKAAATDSDGNVKTDQTTSGDFAIPLSKLESFLNQQGTPTKWTKEALQKLKGGSEKETKAEEKLYTREELKAMSPQYTDAIIDAAVAAGKIKLK